MFTWLHVYGEQVAADRLQTVNFLETETRNEILSKQIHTLMPHWNY